MFRTILLFLIIIFLPSKVFSALTINNISPTTINNLDDIVAISASASGLQNSTQYFQILWTKENEITDYFGMTRNNLEEWFVYKSTPTTTDLSSYFYNFAPVSGTWSGQLSTKIDINDSGFKGVGNYLIKMAKYISGSPSYSNIVSIFVNIAAPTATPTPTDNPILSPEVRLSLDSKKNLDEDFVAKIEAKNLPTDAEFYVKLRGGIEEGKLTKSRTKNGGSWLSDGESWSSFPIIKTNNEGKWSGEIHGLVDGEKETGKYKFLVRFHKKDTESNFDSEIREMDLEKNIVTPILTPTKIPIKTPTATPTEIPTPTTITSVASTSATVLGVSDKVEGINPLFVVSGSLICLVTILWVVVVKYKGADFFQKFRGY